ncbi:MAG: biosynthetic-type acetolactate synthase large subunit [Lachnospiraceae bacterium]
MQLTGAQIVLECLKEQGVDTVFGYPGGSILNIYDALYEYRNEIRHILTAHEQGAAHAADGYARVTGRVGVCMATSGPGATNLVTGIATAAMDSVPLVAITANVAKPLLGKDSFQEIDIAGVVMPITKYSFIVKDIKELAETIRRAFYIAQSGRPGPVLVDITKDVTAAKGDYAPQVPRQIESTTKPLNATVLKKNVKLIEEAKRPVIFVGGGASISGAQQEVIEFAHKIGAPVCDTLMGKGVFPGTDPLYMGMLGMHGTKTANFSVTKCDLLIAVGVRFSDRVTGNTKNFAKNANILQIDIDEAEINKNVLVDAALIGDVKEILTLLNEQITPQTHTQWLQNVAELEKKYPLRYETDQLTGPYILEKLYELTKGEAVITTDVGQHQMWAAQYYKYKEPRTFITSGGLGTMGYGVGAAIGAKTGRPDKTVVNIGGDGCFRMNMNEIATAASNEIPIIQIVLNNHVLGMVRQWQNLFYGQRYSNTVLQDNVDFVAVAKALGAEGIKVTTKEEVVPALEKALALNKPIVLDCHIDSDLKVFPMVPVGADLEDTFDKEDLK